MDDEWDLARFVDAQGTDDSFDGVLEELRRGRKTGHWMWYVFPQVAGLGHSAMSRRFALSSEAEARAFLGHAVLGARLLACARLLIGSAGTASADSIFGAVDAQKLRSSMTLFHRADPAQEVFGQVLDRFFDGQPDPLTVQLLSQD